MNVFEKPTKIVFSSSYAFQLLAQYRLGCRISKSWWYCKSGSTEPWSLPNWVFQKLVNLFSNRIRGVASDFLVGVRFEHFFGWAGRFFSSHVLVFVFSGSLCLLSQTKTKIVDGEKRRGGNPMMPKMILVRSKFHFKSPWAASDRSPFILNYNVSTNQSEAALGCLGRIPFQFQLSFNWNNTELLLVASELHSFNAN